jgi:hypothetical protein
MMGPLQRAAMSILLIISAEMAKGIRKIKREPEKSENLLIK